VSLADPGGAAVAPGGRKPLIALRTVAIAAISEAAIAFVLIHFTQDRSPGTVLRSAIPSPAGAAIGLVGGVLLAGAQVALIARWHRWREFLKQAVGPTPLGLGEIVAIAVLVGVAEELLFRAALQPLIGILAASALFAAVHWNYAATRGQRDTLKLSVLALATIFVVSVVLGWLFERWGLGAAIVAHAVYDTIALLGYRVFLAR
jgi:membrane protease YdiL (CAAX protease family)